MSLVQRRRFLFASGIALAAPALALQDEIIRLGASPLMQPVFEDLARSFYAVERRKLVVVLAQVQELRNAALLGQQLDVVVTENESVFESLQREGRLQRRQIFASGRLAFMVPHSSPLKPESNLSDLREPLHRGHLHRLVVPPPDSPYGKAAQQVLQHAGIAEAIKPYLAPRSFQSEGGQFLRDRSDGALIAMFHARSRELRDQGRIAVMAADWHQPIRYSLALINGANETAAVFARFLQTPAAQLILSEHGLPALPA